MRNVFDLVRRYLDMHRINLERSRVLVTVLSSLVATLWLADEAKSYNYLTYGMGRNDYSNRYSVATNYWPTNDATGAAAGLTYQFGKFELTSLPPGINAAMALQGIMAAEAAWEPYLNINIDSSGTIAGGSNTGLIRIRYDNTSATGAYALPYNWNGNGHNYGEIVFGTQTGSASAWTQTNFDWTMMHEFGHILGLRDMYNDFAGAPLAEDFVDHAVAGNDNPQREAASLQDNIMYQYNYAGNDYTKNPETVVDNDEIAGTTWLWGGISNQIVTGDLTAAGGGRLVVDGDFHHGDQAGNVLTWWDYRVSFKAGGDSNPYVDVEFPGYEGFIADTLGATNPAVVHTDLGNNIHRFEVQQAGWVGNMVLELNSQYSAERRVRSWVTGGGQTDNFVLPVNTKGLAYDGANDWAVVFGPMGPDTQKDYGDAPDSYKTLLASDGPRYQDGSVVSLGSRWDAEPDGQPTDLANGDDENLWGLGGEDDEDGVVFGDSWVDVNIDTAVATAGDLLLRVWWDLNNNGMFDPASELVIDDNVSDLLSTAGEHVKHYDLGFDPEHYYSRFRLTYAIEGHLGDLGEITPYGEFLDVVTGTSIGEVEDYAPVPEPATCTLAFLGLVSLGCQARRRGRG
jgi:hypothetical protein